MGMQKFIRDNIERYEIKRKDQIKKHGTKVCPDCKRSESYFFRNMLGTLECMCGVKFYVE